MNKSVLICLLVVLAVAVSLVHGGETGASSSSGGLQGLRVKRGHGGGGGGYGHGPGSGGGAAGPVYICGYIGSKEGSGYGGGGYGRK